MADNKAEIVIGFDDKELKAGIREFEKNVAKMGDDLNKAFSPKPANKFFEEIKKASSSVFGGMAKDFAVGSLVADGFKFALSAVKDFAIGSIQASQEQENAINNLIVALKRTGEFSEQAVSDLSAFASELQATTIYGDELILSQLALAKSFGATNEQAKDLVKAGANLSATFGGTLEDNVEKLGKTLQGSAGRLGQYIGAIGNLRESQLRAGEAIDIVNEKFAGSAQAQTATFTGTITQLSNAVSDLQEELGGLVTNSETVKSGLGVLTGIFQELTQGFVDSRIAGELQAKGFVDTESEITRLSEKYAKLTEELEKNVAVVQADKNKGFFESLFSFDNAPLAQEKVQKITQELKLLDKQIEMSAQKTAELGQPSKDKGGDGAEKDKKVTDQILAQRAQFYVDLQDLENQNTLAQNEAEVLRRTAKQGMTEQDLLELQSIEQTKLDLQFQAEEAKARLITDSTNRRLAIEKVAGQKSLAQKKLETDQLTKLEQFKAQEEQRMQQLRFQTASNFLNAGIMLTKQNSNEQKALASTLAVMNTWQSASNALATKAPWPLPQIFASSALALGFAQVAQINKAKFANGGIVGGNSFAGDRVPVQVNSGEMILNKSQQKELFSIANGGGSSDAIIKAIDNLGAKIASMQTVVSINSREIARAVRDERSSGFAV